MMRRTVSVAVGLILVGIGGAAFYGFNFSKPLVDYSQEWSFGPTELHQLAFKQDVQSSDIRFVRSTDGKNHIHVEGKAEQSTIDHLRGAKLQDGSLTIDSKSPRRFLNFSFGTLRAKQQVTVSLTEEAAAALDSLQVTSNTGSVAIDGAPSDTASVTTDTGRIRFANYTGEKLTLKADTGTIRAENIRADLEASVDTGSIDIEHLTGKAKLSADTGSVTLVKDDAADADIHTDTGSVRVQVPASFGGFYDLKSDTGSVHAPESKRETNGLIKVRTDTGSIRVTEM